MAAGWLCVLPELPPAEDERVELPAPLPDALPDEEWLVEPLPAPELPLAPRLPLPEGAYCRAGCEAGAWLEERGALLCALR